MNFANSKQFQSCQNLVSFARFYRRLGKAIPKQMRTFCVIENKRPSVFITCAENQKKSNFAIQNKENYW